MCILFWNKISRDFRITSCPTLVCFKQFFDPPFGRAKKYVNTKIQHGHLRVSHSDKPKKSSDWWWKMMEVFLWSGCLEHVFLISLSLSLNIFIIYIHDIWDNPSHLIFCKMVETTNQRWLKPSSGLLIPYSSRLCLGPKCPELDRTEATILNVQAEPKKAESKKTPKALGFTSELQLLVDPWNITSLGKFKMLTLL